MRIEFRDLGSHHAAIAPKTKSFGGSRFVLQTTYHLRTLIGHSTRLLRRSRVSSKSTEISFSMIRISEPTQSTIMHCLSSTFPCRAITDAGCQTLVRKLWCCHVHILTILSTGSTLRVNSARRARAMCRTTTTIFDQPTNRLPDPQTH
jgi:hypothetical protein